MKIYVRKRSMSVALIMAAIMALAVPVAAEAEEIPWGAQTSLPDYTSGRRLLFLRVWAPTWLP